MSGARPRALVLLNPAARGGRGGALFVEVRPVLERELEPDVVESDPAGAWRERIGAALDRESECSSPPAATAR